MLMNENYLDESQEEDFNEQLTIASNNSRNLKKKQENTPVNFKIYHMGINT